MQLFPFWRDIGIKQRMLYDGKRIQFLRRFTL